jgi:hypothetical protein
MILGYSDSLSYALSPLMFVALDAWNCGVRRDSLSSLASLKFWGIEQLYPTSALRMSELYLEPWI